MVGLTVSVTRLPGPTEPMMNPGGGVTVHVPKLLVASRNCRLFMIMTPLVSSIEETTPDNLSVAVMPAFARVSVAGALLRVLPNKLINPMARITNTTLPTKIACVCLNVGIAIPSLLHAFPILSNLGGILYV